MSPITTTPAGAKPAGKDESQSSTTRKPSSSRPQGPPVKCPRCDSPDTKFCYYNNYSLTQPRHFCKTCHRYWTKGGALRNVPIGGGCRKNKKIKPFPRLPSNSKDSTTSSSSDAAAGLKFFQGLSPAMEFQPPKLHTLSNTSAAAAGSIFHHQFASNFSDLSNTSPAISQPPCFNLDPSLLGFAFPLPSSLKQGENLVFQEMVHQSNLATSIESLSSINQDLHWKLQQQRLATLFVEDGSQKEASGNIQKAQPIQFQSLENPKTDGSLSNTEWFLNNSYAPASPATAGNNVNGGAGNWSGGIQAWTELSHYTSLP